MNPPTTLDQLVERWRERGAAPALALGDGPALSYAALAARVDGLAAWLRQDLGVRPGDRLAWLDFNHPDTVALLMALGRLGALLVPLNHRLAPLEWQAVLADCGASRLLHGQAWVDAAAALAQAAGVPAAPLPAETVVCAAPAPIARPDTPALLVYTSGTTGRPKGAVFTQAQLLANMAIAAGVQALTPTDRVLTVLPLFHVGGLCIQTLPALHAGARVDLLPRFDAGETLRHIATHGPTLTLQVPATLAALLAHPLWPQTPLHSLRALWAGSSVLPDALLHAVHARGVPVCNVYGATETGPFSIALAPDHALAHVGSCGWPAPGVEVKLLPVHGRAGDVGELALRGPNVVRHYWPDSPACDGEGFFHSGDLARRAPDGRYTVVGRLKDMIISGGENIYPAEIEQVLATHPDVLDVAVLGVPDARWGEVAVAALVARPGVVVDEAALRALLDARLARYKHPRRFIWLDALPKTALGKVQKTELARALETVKVPPAR